MFWGQFVSFLRLNDKLNKVIMYNLLLSLKLSKNIIDKQIKVCIIFAFVLIPSKSLEELSIHFVMKAN